MTNIENAARRLFSDWENRTPYAALSGDCLIETVSDAYAAQAMLQSFHVPKRGKIAGRKIALSSKAMQNMVGMDEPVAGAFFANEVHETGATIHLSHFIRLGLEFELALELGQDVAPSEQIHTEASVVDLVAGVRPAFELIEDRAADYSDLHALTLVADNAWCGGVVLGPKIENWRSLDLNDTPAVVFQSDQPQEHTNTGAATPLASLAWVLNHFSARGIPLAKGEHVITGSAVRTRFPNANETLRYEVGTSAVEIMVV